MPGGADAPPAEGAGGDGAEALADAPVAEALEADGDDADVRAVHEDDDDDDDDGGRVVMDMDAAMVGAAGRRFDSAMDSVLPDAGDADGWEQRARLMAQALLAVGRLQARCISRDGRERIEGLRRLLAEERSIADQQLDRERRLERGPERRDAAPAAVADGFRQAKSGNFAGLAPKFERGKGSSVQHVERVRELLHQLDLPVSVWEPLLKSTLAEPDVVEFVTTQGAPADAEPRERFERACAALMEYEMGPRPAQHLMGAFLSFRRRPTETATATGGRLRALVDQLAAFGVRVPEMLVVQQMMESGLPADVSRAVRARATDEQLAALRDFLRLAHIVEQSIKSVPPRRPAQSAGRPTAGSAASQGRGLGRYQTRRQQQQQQQPQQQQQQQRGRQGAWAATGAARGRGRGRGSLGAAPFTGDCFRCGRQGHRAAQCPEAAEQRRKEADNKVLRIRAGSGDADGGRANGATDADGGTEYEGVDFIFVLRGRDAAGAGDAAAGGSNAASSGNAAGVKRLFQDVPIAAPDGAATTTTAVLVDSGADVSIIDPALVERLGLEVRKPTRSVQQLQGAAQVLGAVQVTLGAGSSASGVELQVARGFQGVLLGTPHFEAFSFQLQSGPDPFGTAQAGRGGADDGVDMIVPAGAVDEALAEDRKAAVFDMDMRERIVDGAQVDDKAHAYVVKALAEQLQRQMAIPRTSRIRHPAVRQIKIVVDESKGPATGKEYPLDKAHEAAMREVIGEMLGVGEIREVTPDMANYWLSPVFMIRKKAVGGGKPAFRFLCDMRAVNERVQNVDACMQMPTLDDIFIACGRFKIASVLDISGYFHQIELPEQYRYLTRFTTLGRFFEYTVIPQGWNIAPGIAQFVITAILLGVDGDFIMSAIRAFIDDLLGVSEGESFAAAVEEHAIFMVAVLTRINDANARLNLEKSLFGVREVLMLGWRLNGRTRSLDPAKVAAVADWKLPTTQRGVKRFVGFANFLRAAIPRFSELIRPFTRDGKSRGAFHATAEQVTAFQATKRAILAAIALAVPDWTRPFVLITDASEDAIAAALAQRDDNGELHFLGFSSRVLPKPALRWAIGRKELWAVVQGCLAFKYYLLHRQFELHSDHAALQWILRPQAKKLSYAVARVLTELSQFRFSFHYVTSAANVADHLTRRSLVAQTNEERHQCIPAAVPVPRALALQAHDHVALPQASFRDFFTLESGLTDPGVKAGEMIRKAHVTHGHCGAERVVKHLVYDEKLFWSGMLADVKKELGQCRPCLSFSVQRRGWWPQRSVVARAEGVFDMVSIDLMGRLADDGHGNRFAVVMVDAFSKFVITDTLPTKGADDVARFPYRVVLEYGPGARMSSDRGGEFVNDTLRAMMKLTGTEHNLG